MLRKNQIVLATALLPLLAITACSGGKATATARVAATPQNSVTSAAEVPQGQVPAAPAAGEQTLESKLAVGILELKGTDKEVTAEQATALVTLWQSMKSLNENKSSSQDEVSALYKQIEAALTADQIQAITDMTFAQDGMQTLMDKYGVSMPTRGDGTMKAPDGTMPAPDGTMQAPGGGPGGDGGQDGPQGTPSGAGPAGGPGGRGGGMGNLFIDPLIEYLQERAG